MKARFAFAVSTALALGIVYFVIADRTPDGTECQRSRSPDGRYLAERCLLEWVPGGNSKYVGRLFDGNSGRRLAQHVFDSSTPTILWSDYQGETVLFSVGDGGDDATYISIPPSGWDRLLAVRPRFK
ncbi:hypothetical protein LJ656_19885 [Paraburkholderia sp. MMS20-SJTR3]|uniref:WD40-like Beta Propeller Repeat n=1 Tax=Paraburkholderia sejongensis TaxID=2886946 RepID=A0ABS8JY88_9BURK|nr:hypothetical protein [Paraburkholderia sp. MMS20-SJTR3]MCC8394859.1 hypothetical protein [Paraburkholderia sp. MMS20-SJTR3]